jgi:ATP-binding cassette subfamily C protein LapB
LSDSNASPDSPDDAGEGDEHTAAVEPLKAPPAVAVGDPLLACLVAMTRIHHRPQSAEGLMAGLPSADGRMTPDLFIRAAQRAGFKARLVQRDLQEISPLVLPVALQLRDGHACVLASFDGSRADVSFPGDGTDTVSVDANELDGQYLGSCLLLRPDSTGASADGDEADGSPGGHWFWHVLKRSRGLYGEVLVASFLINLFALVTPLFVMNVYDRVVPNHATETLWVLASGAFLVFGFDLVMKSLRGYFIDVAGKRSDILLSSSTFARVMDIKLAARPSRVGSFANNLQEFDGFREFFTSTTLIALIDLPFVLLFVLLIYSLGGPVVLVPATAIPLIVLVGLALQRPLQDVITQSFSEAARKHAMLIETLSSLDAIKGARAEGLMQQKWEAFNGRLARLGLRTRLLSLTAVNVAQVVQQLATVAVVIVGVYQIMDGALSVGGLIACTILTGRCLAPMAQVATIFTRYHHSVAAYGAIDHVMGLPTERPSSTRFLHRPTVTGEFALKGVTFTYPGQKMPAVRDISLSIAAGERVAIIGRMGSGKTTVQKLLMKFYEPDEGSILVAGTDIAQVDPTDLRRRTGYVPQDVMLIDGTVRENIALGAPQATDEAIINAATIGGINDFLRTHPDGYDLSVGERGQYLSGGQRQAIIIARGLINDPSILLFDEPTNAMDNTAELNFKQALAPLLPGRTLILVTHKTSMLSLVDRLLVLHDGQLVADGPRDDVLRSLGATN